MRSPVRLAASLSTAAVGIYLAVGLLWTAVHLGDFPHYGDTKQYVSSARTLTVNEHRGIVFPWILRVSSRALGVELPKRVSWEEEGPCALPAEMASVQLLQIALSAACIWYLLTVLFHYEKVAAESKRIRFLALFALLLFDPVTNHFNMAFMSDGLASAFSLAFCAALWDLASRRIAPAKAGAILFVSFTLASGLRVDKKWILSATFLVCILVWWRWRSSSARHLGRGWGKRMAAAVVLIGVGTGLNAAVHRLVYRPTTWMPLVDSALHLRLVFPHLSDVYDALPPRVQERIERKDAQLYDQHVNNPPKLMHRITKGNAALRREITLDMVRTVLPRKWHLIFLDVIRDSVEGFLPAFSFYLRVGVRHVWGYQAIDEWFFLDAANWDYERLIFHHPRLSKVYLLVAVAVWLSAMPLAWGRWRRGWRPQNRQALCDGVFRFVPMLTLWVVHSVAFASYININNVRYSLAAQVFLLTLIYGSALRTVTADGPRTSHPANL